MTDDLIERVARWMCDQSPYSTDDWRDYVEDAMSLLRVIDLPTQREGAAKVFEWLIAKAQEPVEIYTGSYAKPLHADDRTAWLRKMQEEYNARDT